MFPTPVAALRTSPIPSARFLTAFANLIRDGPGHDQRSLYHGLGRDARDRHGSFSGKGGLPSRSRALQRQTAPSKRRAVQSRRTRSLGPEQGTNIQRRDLPDKSSLSKADSGQRRRYSAAAQAVQVTATDLELESVVDVGLEGAQATSEEDIAVYSGHGEFRVTKHLSSDTRLGGRMIHVGEDQVKKLLRELRAALDSTTSDHDHLFATYTAIPQPRVKYLTDQLLTDLLAHMRRIQIKEPHHKVQYFTIMDDMVQSGLPLKVRDFNSAMVWVGKAGGNDKVVGLEKAMDIFHKMERRGEYKADNVTFNTLAHLALKANKDDIVQMLLEEMRNRNMQTDRYTALLKITYYGKLQNRDALKDSYRAMIAAGELVDTISLNCLIKAFMRAEDPLTAEKIFEKMKKIDAEKTHKVEPPHDWTGQRRLGHILKFSAWQLKRYGTLKSQLQDATPIAPNSHTYRILIEYHTKRTGDMDRIMTLLSEMLQRGLHVTAPIFHIIFSGFKHHGRTRFSSWRTWSLRRVFELFTHNAEWLKRGRGSIVDDRVGGNGTGRIKDFDPRLMEAILEAFFVYQDGELTKGAYKRIQEFWTPDEEWEGRLSRIVNMRTVRNMVYKHDGFIKKSSDGLIRRFATRATPFWKGLHRRRRRLT